MNPVSRTLWSIIAVVFGIPAMVALLGLIITTMMR
jgi:hypothetical protein